MREAVFAQNAEVLMKVPYVRSNTRGWSSWDGTWRRGFIPLRDGEGRGGLDRQAGIAVGDGLVAAMQAVRYIKHVAGTRPTDTKLR